MGRWHTWGDQRLEQVQEQAQGQLPIGGEPVKVFLQSLSGWEFTFLLMLVLNVVCTIAAWINYADNKDRARKLIGKNNQEMRAEHLARSKMWARMFFLSPFIGTPYWITRFVWRLLHTGGASISSMAKDTLSSNVKEKSPGQLSVVSKEGGELSRND